MSCLIAVSIIVIFWVFLLLGQSNKELNGDITLKISLALLCFGRLLLWRRCISSQYFSSVTDHASVEAVLIFIG